MSGRAYDEVVEVAAVVGALSGDGGPDAPVAQGLALGLELDRLATGLQERLAPLQLMLHCLQHPTQLVLPRDAVKVMTRDIFKVMPRYTFVSIPHTYTEINVRADNCSIMLPKIYL